MQLQSLPPHTRYAIFAIIALFVTSFNLVPDIIAGIALLTLGVLLGRAVWQRIALRGRSSSVTYWRGVRYEVSKANQRFTWRDIQPEGLWILITIIATTLGFVLVFDAIF